MENPVNKDASTCGKCLVCSGYVNNCLGKFRAIYRNVHKKIALWCALVYCKLQESYQRLKAVWKRRMPSVKVRWVDNILLFTRVTEVKILWDT